MNIVPRSVRDAFRKEQIRAIEKEVRAAYSKRIREATTKMEKKALRAQRDEEIATRTAPLVREGKPFLPPGHCRGCGYNLMGNVSGVCPECGTEIEPVDGVG